jgi:hypothetical protein
MIHNSLLAGVISLPDMAIAVSVLYPLGGWPLVTVLLPFVYITIRCYESRRVREHCCTCLPQPDSDHDLFFETNSGPIEQELEDLSKPVPTVVTQINRTISEDEEDDDDDNDEFYDSVEDQTNDEQPVPNLIQSLAARLSNTLSGNRNSRSPWARPVTHNQESSNTLTQPLIPKTCKK